MSRAATLVLILLSLLACVRSTAVAPPAGQAGHPAAAAPSAPAAQVTPTAPRWPALDREPELGVMLQRDTTLRVRLLLPHRLADGRELPAGSIDITAAGEGFRIAGRVVAEPRCELLAVGSGRTFSIDGVTCSGRLRLARQRDTVEAIEVVGLETWLAGVLPAEMNPRWPVAALAAQAIVARSYGAARWQARAGQAWHLLRGTADVAYDGAEPPSAEVAEAIARTRGELLVHGGQAILARFHACSGGRTEDSAALWPDATLLDGRTPLAGFMRPVEDTASVEGARGLGWTRTHQQWRAAFRLDELSDRLGSWSRADRRRPRIGAVRAVAVAATTASGRVARVTVTHAGPEGVRSDELSGLEFRLAVGANQLRSLWWEKAVMASARGGQFVVEGRGFGHGVGLPQVSAWALAGDGVSGEDIVARYYPGTTLARMWR
jgi:SpoIID/LytB domain protein